MKRLKIAKRAIFICLAACGFFLMVICLLVLHRQTSHVHFFQKRVVGDTSAGDSVAQPRVNMTALDEFRYMPVSARAALSEREFLVIFGIPSVDIEGRRRRRNLQRSTCWRYAGVATRANNFTGAMLVLYVLARHPSHNYEYSAALTEEAATWGDIVALALNEGRVSTNKKIAGDGYWGNEAEIGMSRKTYLWFEFALRVFPTAPYVAKGDDDMFIRVPQYLADMRTLPRRGIYWGLMVYTIHKAANISLKIDFFTGPCYTLGRDVAEQVVLYEPLRRLVHLPYSKERESEFLALNMDHEDVMVGRVLMESNKISALCVSVLYVAERSCSFHNVDLTNRLKSVSQSSIMVHHLWESEYWELMACFGNDSGHKGQS